MISDMDRAMRQQEGTHMAKERAKGWMTGMHGVYLVAAELTRKGFIVSPTLRNAPWADLLVTDPRCARAWSVQVKTNGKAVHYWLLNKDAAAVKSESHIYVFVNIEPDNQAPEFYVVPSAVVAGVMKTKTMTTKSTWYWFDRKDVAAEYRDFSDAFTTPGARPSKDRAEG